MDHEPANNRVDLIRDLGLMGVALAWILAIWGLCESAPGLWVFSIIIGAASAAINAIGVLRSRRRKVSAKTPLLALILSLPFTCCCLFLALILAVVGGLGPPPEYDVTKDIRTGEEARTRILRWELRNTTEPRLPTSAEDFFSWEGGSFGGMILYYSFDCANQEDCLKAFEALSGRRRGDLQPWEASRYAVVMDGPGFYHASLRGVPWSVRDIQNGKVIEIVDGGHERMTYYAIDLDRNRLYYHYESGGFPPDAPGSRRFEK